MLFRSQLLNWTPTGSDPVIWLSPVERLGTSKPVRGGTPVCWPWFAAHPTDAAKPAHGFVRTRLWDVEAAGSSDAGAWVRLGTAATDADAGLWPHRAAVKLQVTLDRHLTLTLTTTNTGDTPFKLTQALHTYFSIGDIGDIDVTGFDGESYQDKVDGFRRHHQSGAIVFPGEVDRIYDAHTGVATINDRRRGRRIAVAQEGSRSAVVWNPGPDRAARLGDMGPDGWRQFVCVETTNAGDDVCEIAVGASHALTATYTVTKL